MSDEPIRVIPAFQRIMADVLAFEDYVFFENLQEDPDYEMDDDIEFQLAGGRAAADGDQNFDQSLAAKSGDVVDVEEGKDEGEKIQIVGEQKDEEENQEQEELGEEKGEEEKMEFEGEKNTLQRDDGEENDGLEILAKEEEEQKLEERKEDEDLEKDEKEKEGEEAKEREEMEMDGEQQGNHGERGNDLMRLAEENEEQKNLEASREDGELEMEAKEEEEEKEGEEEVLEVEAEKEEQLLKDIKLLLAESLSEAKQLVSFLRSGKTHKARQIVDHETKEGETEREDVDRDDKVQENSVGKKKRVSKWWKSLFCFGRSAASRKGRGKGARRSSGEQ